MTAGPILAIALGIGLLIGLVQAATSIRNDLEFWASFLLFWVPWLCCHLYVIHDERLFYVYFEEIAEGNIMWIRLLVIRDSLQSVPFIFFFFCSQPE